MAWSPQLGMRVFDPREGAQIGLQAGQAFARSYGAAQDRQLDERKLQMMEDEVAEKARLTLRRQIGLQAMTEETQALIAGGVDPDTARKNAFLKHAPMIYGNSDQGLAVLQRIEASEEANNIRRMGQIELDRRQREIAELQAGLRERDQEIKLMGIEQRAERAGSSPAPIAIAREMVSAEEKVEQAREAGDLKALKKAENYKNQLEKAQSLQNRDPGKMAVLSVIKSAIGTIDRQLHGQMAQFMTPEEKSRLEKERADLLEQLREAGGNISNPTAASPEAPTPAAPTSKRLRWTGSEFVPIK